MFAEVHSLGVHTLDGFCVRVEADISAGLPQFCVVGLPDSAVKESSERVHSAIKNLGFTYPVSRITVNLSPADIRKTGPVYDLPIFLALLCADGQLPAVPKNSAFIGELSLDGAVRGVAGVLPMAIAAHEAGIECLFVPAENAAEAAVVDSLCIYAVSDARQVVDHLRGKAPLSPYTPAPFTDADTLDGQDFSDVRGQPEARRAIEIAAAGGHNLLLIGPPGTGKSMLAKRMPGILPRMTREEAMETSRMYSVAGILPKGRGLLEQRPFRAPHHSVSATALAGGGTIPRPGEVSLAHHGVLFLDELPEFNRSTLEALRQPLENGEITVSRAEYHHTYPARFQLIAAMNPCRCGNLGIPGHECSKAPKCAAEYQAKLSGPFLDRIDIHIYVPPVSPWDIANKEKGESSAVILNRVLAARKIQKERFARLGHPELLTNSQLKGKLLEETVSLDDDAQKLLIDFADKFKLSARGYHRTLRLARTIADLQNETNVHRMHIAEALNYRRMATAS